MLITLAYPYEDHDPDETIEVDPPIGRGLIRDGLARDATAISDNTFTDNTFTGDTPETTSAPPTPPVFGDTTKEAGDAR